MLGLRTPTKTKKCYVESPEIREDSFDEIAGAMTFTPLSSQDPSTSRQAPGRKTASQRGAVVELSKSSPQLAPKYKNKTAEAKALLIKAKLHLGNSRNLKAEIKKEVNDAIEKLYCLVKELEEGQKLIKPGESSGSSQGSNVSHAPPSESENSAPCPSLTPSSSEQLEFNKRLEENNQLLRENCQMIEELKIKLDTHQKSLERTTYASVVAGVGAKTHEQRTALHSVVVTSSDGTDSGDEVLTQIRQAVNAKEGGIVVDRIRKAKDSKVIVGCRNKEEIMKVKERIQERNKKLNVEEVKNKDPLVILFGVLQYNTDEDIIKSIRVQNKNLLQGVEVEDDRMEVKYRKKARNNLMAHVVLKVSPIIWKRITDAGTVQVDLQRIRAADQSPLIQCSRCLGYGHGRKFCRDAVDLCSHCGGQHLREKCADWLADVSPRCVNCSKTKSDSVEHNAFSNECPVRRKWEALARSTVAYC